MPANFEFKIDSFSVSRNGTLVFSDSFEDGVPPPDAPELFPGGATDYSTSGTFSESGGRALMNSSSAVDSAGADGGTFSFLGALLLQNIDPANTVNGLKSNHDFSIDATYDFVAPDRGGAYGIRLTDRSADQAGDDIIELVVRRGYDGVLRVQLREIDFVNHEVTNIGSVSLDTKKFGSFDQIALHLRHDNESPGAVTASFDLLQGGAVTKSVTISETAQIFGTETPLYAGDDENWTRAQFVAYAPDPDTVTGNTIEGDSSANRLSGTNIKDYIFGFDGADKLYGMEGDDDLFGGAGDDLLDGGWGADRMFGGAGNDTYIVDNLGDQVLESSSSDGNDVVRASVDFILPSFVEELAFSGRSSINGTGNDLPNKIIGNGAANILNGGAGADMLTGGNGPDTFVFVRGEAAGDVVTDFDGNGPRAGDTLRFEGYGPGATFIKQDATHWVISSGDGQTQETITLTNGASVHATDYLFVV